MIRFLSSSVLGLAVLSMGSTAAAATWADYEQAFPAFPCQDGWVACLADGARVDPDLSAGPSGKPMVAHARVDFFSLQPTAGFSPFVMLSEYRLETAAVAVAPPLPDAGVPEPVPYEAAPVPYEAAPSHPAPAPSPAPAPMTRPGSAPAPSPAPAPGGMVRPGSAVAPSGAVRPGSAVAPSGAVRPGSAVAPSPSPAPGGMVRPGSAVRPGSSAAPAPEVAVAPSPSPAPGGMVRPGSAPAPVTAVNAVVAPPTTQVPEPVVAVTCDNLVGLEPAAMIGRLSDDQVACLEASFADAERQTDKKKISLVLIANANGKGDRRTWEKLIRRHLEEIDQSDPDLCYAYAAHLARRGPSRSQSVIRWAGVALENRSQWVGETYKSRVYSLYKLRAVASNALWQQAEERHAAAPGAETEQAVERTRGQTKTFSREWYEYAKEAGKDTTTPLQLCVSAAGTSEFCEGS